MEDKTYQVSGWQYGDFADNNGKVVHYANLFCLSKIEGQTSESFRYEGYKAHVFKCVSPEVLKGLKQGDHVSLYFNQFGKVSFVKTVKE